jgi:hypothetical protein
MYLAIDPGGTTGLAFIDGNNNWITSTASTPNELYDMIDPAYKAIIIETFQAQRISSYGLHTVRLVGGVEGICYKLGITLIKHMPIKRRPYQKQAEYMLRSFIHVVHEEDALAHLLTYLHLEDKTRMPLMRRENLIGVPNLFAQGGRVTGLSRSKVKGVL